MSTEERGPRFDVVGVGNAACDYVTPVERFPGPDEKVRAETLVMVGGGSVGTALVAMARLGLRVAFAGSLGEDEAGRFILDELERDDIDTTFVTTHRGARSPIAFCLSAPPARTVVSVRSTAPPLAPDAARTRELLDTRFLHLDGSQPASLELARAARASDVGVSVDLQHHDDLSEALLPLSDVAVMSEAYARARFGDRPPEDTLQDLYRPQMQLVAITRGAAGTVATDGKETFTVPAEKVEVVDSTGAGDAFHGALLTGLLAGKNVRRALELASHVAALSCRELGGRAGIPVRDELGDEWL